MTRHHLLAIACGPVIGALLALAAFHPLEVLAGASVLGTCLQLALFTAGKLR